MSIEGKPDRPSKNSKGKDRLLAVNAEIAANNGGFTPEEIVSGWLALEKHGNSPQAHEKENPRQYFKPKRLPPELDHLGTSFTSNYADMTVSESSKRKKGTLSTLPSIIESEIIDVICQKKNYEEEQPEWLRQKHIVEGAAEHFLLDPSPDEKTLSIYDSRDGAVVFQGNREGLPSYTFKAAALPAIKKIVNSFEESIHSLKQVKKVAETIAAGQSITDTQREAVTDYLSRQEKRWQNRQETAFPVFERALAKKNKDLFTQLREQATSYGNFSSEIEQIFEQGSLQEAKSFIMQEQARFADLAIPQETDLRSLDNLTQYRDAALGTMRERFAQDPQGKNGIFTLFELTYLMQAHEQDLLVAERRIADTPAWQKTQKMADAVENTFKNKQKKQVFVLPSGKLCNEDTEEAFSFTKENFALFIRTIFPYREKIATHRKHKSNITMLAREQQSRENNQTSQRQLSEDKKIATFQYLYDTYLAPWKDHVREEEAKNERASLTRTNIAMVTALIKQAAAMPSDRG